MFDNILMFTMFKSQVIYESVRGVMRTDDSGRRKQTLVRKELIPV